MEATNLSCAYIDSSSIPDIPVRLPGIMNRKTFVIEDFAKHEVVFVKLQMV